MFAAVAAELKHSILRQKVWYLATSGYIYGICIAIWAKI